MAETSSTNEPTEAAAALRQPREGAESKNKGEPMTEPTFTDAEALDQIAAALGLYNTDPGNNPGIIADIDQYVQNTGRKTNVPEGA